MYLKKTTQGSGSLNMCFCAALSQVLAVNKAQDSGVLLIRHPMHWLYKSGAELYSSSSLFTLGLVRPLANYNANMLRNKLM